MTLNTQSLNIYQPQDIRSHIPVKKEPESQFRDEGKAGMLWGALAGLGCLAFVAICALKVKQQKASLQKKFPLEDLKLSEPWVDNYIKLCQKYGKKIRTTDGVAGDWLHYKELTLRDTNPEKYKHYRADREINGNIQ